MEYTDRIYGRIKINEPVILDLINSPSLQRIKGVDQHGHFEPYFPGTFFSRFEHSLGVFILLKKFKTSLEEQIAGLIHDVSHTVFSHVGDYVYGFEKTHTLQDNLHQQFIENSEIPKILNKYKIDYKYILDDKNFLLKERELPDLCADRIDYFLREIKVNNEANLEKINQFLNDFIIIDNFWVFKNKDLAKEYALLYVKINNWFWAGLESGVMLKTMGELLKYALLKKIITKDDLFTTDKEVWTKIKAASVKNDINLTYLIKRADNKIKYISSNKDDYDLYTKVKSRAVDPLILVNNSLKRLSELDSKFVKIIKKNLIAKEYYIKFND